MSQRIDSRCKPSFSVINRLRRLLWMVTHALLVSWTPRPFHAWRAAIYRVFGAKLGRNCHIYAGAMVWAPWHLVCGEVVGIADGAIIYNMDLVTIGDHAVISQGAHLCTGTHDYCDPDFRLVTKPIIIGREAWICAEAFLHPGVSIGAGAVIGARAVVTSDMPPWMVCAGHPCAPLKPRVLRTASEAQP